MVDNNWQTKGFVDLGLTSILFQSGFFLIREHLNVKACKKKTKKPKPYNNKNNLYS